MESGQLKLYSKVLEQLSRQEFDIDIPSFETVNKDISEFDNNLRKLITQLKQEHEKNQLIIHISNEINKGKTLDDVLEVVYSSFKNIIPYDRMACALLDNDGYLKAVWQKTEYSENIYLDRGFKLHLKETNLNQILESKSPRIINDLDAYCAEHPKSQSTKLVIKEGIKSNFTWPLVADDKPVGFLFFSSRHKNAYNLEKVDIFYALARQVSFLVEKSHLFHQVESLNSELINAMELVKQKSCIDALTGIYHRGTILEFLDNALLDAQKKTQSVSIIMLDLDHFKAINDTYGHIAGDSVLKTIAETLKTSLRSYDRVGRYGGEEFLIVLSNSDRSMAMLVAERIREAISELVFYFDGCEVKVTGSLGITTKSSSTPTSVQDDMLMEADCALYEAKSKGRNRVVMATC